MLKKITFFLFILFYSSTVFASGIKGTVKDNKGEPLAYATIFVQETGSGTVTNAEGYYEVNLPVGGYTVNFQYLGYETAVEKVNISRSAKEVIDIILSPQSLELGVVEITDGREDPAYTVMRKAIAKATYHRQQLDSYSAQVYIKGSGRLLKSPKLLKGVMEREGMDSTTAFLTESVSEVSYKRPNTYTEKVISIRQQGDDNSTSPNAYLNSSFYEPQVIESVSPLSPKAMGYYRFEFLGSYVENGQEINKIKVTPRSRGEGVFEGTINIVEDWWSIHSLNLKTNKMGFVLNLQQFYGLIDNKSWLPVTHKFIIDIKIFGFNFKYDYLATAKNYKIALNPDLDVDFKIIDEKIEKEVAAEMQKEFAAKKGNPAEKLDLSKELTRKNLRKLMKQYEKEERKQQDDPKVETVSFMEIDSAAQNKDTAFWAAIRPVPLTTYEVKSYRTTDSLAVVAKAEKTEGKETKSAKKKVKFEFFDLVRGANYKINNRTRLIYETPLLHSNFNTVEGYHIGTDLKIRHRFENEQVLKVGVVPRYSFARNTLIGKSYLDLDIGKKYRKGKLKIEGGRYIAQINDNNPINPYINAFYSLLFQDNYMKILEKDYLKGMLRKRVSDKLTINIGSEYAQRTQLNNDPDVSPWFGNRDDFTPNIPPNVEATIPETLDNKTFNIEAGFVWKPWIRYNLDNDEKSFFNRGPQFFANYRKGFVDSDYDFLEAGTRYTWNRWDGSELSIKVAGGIFLNDDDIFLPDFKHFNGNRTVFVTSDPVESFRLLDYYALSTKDKYAEIHTHYQFRKLLLTQIPEVWMVGLKENVFASYLATPSSDNYMEIGYGLDNIFKFFRIEAVASFQDFKYQDFGVRIGISTAIGVGISDNEDGDGTAMTIGL